MKLAIKIGKKQSPKENRQRPLNSPKLAFQKVEKTAKP
jgi:hypothetical protein